MGAPYSLDLRERVVAAVASGVSCRAAAARFDVSVSTAIRWTRRMKEVGSPAARPMGGKRPFLLASQAEWVLTRLKQKPDLTLNALLMELRARGVTVSYYGVWHFVSRAGLSFKKTGSDRRPACSDRNGPRYPEPEGSGRRFFGGFDPVKKVVHGRLRTCKW
jgi:transposase